MNKVRIAWGKLSPAIILSLGFIILGIGCISWALFGMWVQSDYSDDARRSRYFISANIFEEPAQSDPSLTLPSADNNLYPVYPAEGDNIGTLMIPALKRTLPILQGTGEKELKKGVGHFIQSVLPGEEDNCVISGHRETVFRQIGDLNIGDTLIVKTSAGTFTYAISDIRIVHEDDKTVIVPTDHAVLTMTTCYPFYTPGYSPDRYIVSANLGKSDKYY